MERHPDDSFEMQDEPQSSTLFNWLILGATAVIWAVLLWWWLA